MRALLGTAVVTGLAAVVLVAAGCATNDGVVTDTSEPHAYVNGMMCPECETVWVRERQRHGPRVTRLHSVREMTCVSCDKTAEAVLLSDGQVQLHDCPECKVTPTVVNVDRSGPKHLHQRIH